MAYNIPLRVRNLIKKAGSSDPYDIARFLNIKIKTVNMPEHANGFWRRVLRRKYICVSDRLEEWQRKAVIGTNSAILSCIQSINISAWTVVLTTVPNATKTKPIFLVLNYVVTLWTAKKIL